MNDENRKETVYVRLKFCMTALNCVPFAHDVAERAFAGGTYLVSFPRHDYKCLQGRLTIHSLRHAVEFRRTELDVTSVKK